MKKKVLITTIIIILAGISYVGFQFLKVEKEKKALENTLYKGEIEFIKTDITQTTKLKNGRLISVTDSLDGFEIDLTQLDSVRENLNGFWISEDDADGQEILWLDFNKGKNSTSWWEMPYTAEIERTKTIPVKSCQTYIGLIQIDGQIKMERAGLVFSDTTDIEYLSKNKFKIHGTTYLKHKGYDFLKLATE